MTNKIGSLIKKAFFPSISLAAGLAILNLFDLTVLNSVLNFYLPLSEATIVLGVIAFLVVLWASVFYIIDYRSSWISNQTIFYYLKLIQKTLIWTCVVLLALQILTSILILYVIPLDLLPDWLVFLNSVLLALRLWLYALPLFLLILGEGVNFAASYRDSSFRVWSVTYFYDLYKSRFTSYREQKLKPWIEVVVVGGILVWATALRFINLGVQPFYHDEQWFASSTKSFLEFGVSKLWNPILLEPGSRDYPTLITMMLALPAQVLGYSEFVLRATVALLGVVVVLLTWFIARRVLKSQLGAYLASAIVAFGIISTYMSRFLRHYTLFTVVGLLIFVMFWYLFRRLLDTKRINYFYLFGSLASVAFVHLFITPFAISYYAIWLIYFITALVVAKQQRKVLFTFVVLGIIVLFLETSGAISIFRVRNILINSLEFGWEQGRTVSYIIWSFGETRLPYYWVAFLVALFTVQAFRTRKLPLILNSLFIWIPFLLLCINVAASHDFRYVTNFLPHVAIAIAWVVCEVVRSVKGSVLQAGVFFLIALIILPITIPGIYLPPLFEKAQADWQGVDAETLHRRAIAPDYYETMELLDGQLQAGDSVIIADGYLYLKPREDVEYYALNNWANTSKVLNYRTNLEKSVYEFIEKKQRFFLITSNIHLLDQNLSFYLQDQCRNLMAKPDQARNASSPYYWVAESYFPNLYMCESDSD